MRTRRRSSLIKGKIQNLSSLKKIIAKLKIQGKTIVFTNGCFDLVHFGHAQYLAKAKEKGDILIVGLNSDSSVKRIKGNKRPIVNEKNRAGLLAALQSVDYVVKFGQDTPINTIRAIKPDILIKGADWNKSNIIGSSFVASYGGKTQTIKLVKGLSTSNIILKIAKNF